MVDERIVTLETLAAALPAASFYPYRSGVAYGSGRPIEWKYLHEVERAALLEDLTAILAALPPAPAMDVERLIRAVQIAEDLPADPFYVRDNTPAERALDYAREYAALEADPYPTANPEGPITDANGDELERGAPD